MSTQIEAEKKQYYDYLEKAQKGGLDISTWLIWFLECLDRAIHLTRFVDTVLTTTVTDEKPLDPQRLFWCFEPNDYVEKADFRKPVSDRIDRVLVLLSVDNTRITWVTPPMLAKANLAEDVAGKIAFENLSQEMLNTKIELSEIDGVRLGYLNTTLPFKASLLMAPNLKTCVENELGGRSWLWPLTAISSICGRQSTRSSSFASVAQPSSNIRKHRIHYRRKSIQFQTLASRPSVSSRPPRKASDSLR